MGGRQRIGRLGGVAGSGIGRIVALGGAMLLMPLAANNALAACVLTGSTYTCSGDTASAVSYNTDALAVVVDNTFNNTSAINPAAIDLTVPTSGDLSLTAQAGSFVSGTSYGIRTTNNGHGATTIDIGGTVQGGSLIALYVYNGFTATDMTISQGAGSLISGTNGISLSNYGHGATTIDIAGTVLATTGSGISAFNNTGATDLTIAEAAGGSITGSGGISASNYGSGALLIDIAGSVDGTADPGVSAYNNSSTSSLTIIEAAGGSIKGGRGISASNYGTGAFVIDIAGAVEATAGNGVYAYNSLSSSSLTISEAAGGSIKGSAGISASNYGSGVLAINIAGAVEATSDIAVYGYNNTSAAGLSLTEAAGGSIKGHDGISFSNYGSGATTIDIAGTIEATSGKGIDAYNNSSTSDMMITEAAGASIKGSSYGISANNFGTGRTSVLIAGDVTGTSTVGVDVVSGPNSKGMTVALLSGAIVGGQTGVSAYDYSSYVSTINVAADVTVTGGTYGMKVRSGSAGGLISLAGRISGSTASIYFDNGSGANTLNLFNTAVLSGAVNFNSINNNTINFHSGSYDVAVLGYNLANNNVHLLSNTQTLVTPGLAGNSTSGRLVVVDTAAAPKVAELTRDFAGAALGAVGDVASAGGGQPGLLLGYAAAPEQKPNPTDIQAGSSAGQLYDAYGNLVWIRGFGGARTQEAQSSRLGLDSHHYGLIGGYNHVYDDWRIGVFGGGGQASGTLSDDASSIRSDIGLAGIYARKAMGTAWVETTVSGGYAGTETERRINGGAETATGSFGSGFAAVQMALAARYALGSNWSITPSLKNRYTAIFSEAYTETGSAQNVTYDAGVSQALEQSVEAKVAYSFATDGGRQVNYWLKGAAFAQEAVGDSRIDATALGVGLATDVGDRDVVYGGTVGLGLDVMLSDRASVFLAVDGTLATNQSRSGAMRGGWKLAF